MLLRDVALTSQRIAATRRRGEKIALVAGCVRALAPDEIPVAVAWLAGELRQGRIGLAYAAVARTADVPPAGQASLGVGDADRALEAIAAASGRGAGAARLERFTALLAAATADEQRFLRALVLGELRQGALESLVVEGVARAAGVEPAAVRRAQMLAADLPRVAAAALAGGAAALAGFDVEVFRPVQPMLASTAEDVDDALERLGVCAIELKLDGARVQVHKRDDEVRVYTRRLNDVTAAVPEVVESVLALPARELILDGETIALDRDRRPLPFQVTMRRFGRRLAVDEMRAKLPLDVFWFDCLYRDGESTIDAPLGERAGILDALVPPRGRVERIEAADAGAAAVFLGAALERGHEGVMAKSLTAPYEAGRRGAGWLKLKQAHTLDLVVLAAEWGSGRRRGLLSNLHLGARDPASGGFVMLGKTFKGLTDRMLAWQTEALLAREVARDGHVVHVRPELVVEIAFNDVQESPQYPAGLALRFARVKSYREDKSPGEADTVETVRRLHERASGRA